MERRGRHRKELSHHQLPLRTRFAALQAPVFQVLNSSLANEARGGGAPCSNAVSPSWERSCCPVSRCHVDLSPHRRRDGVGPTGVAQGLRCEAQTLPVGPQPLCLSTDAPS